MLPLILAGSSARAAVARRVAASAPTVPAPRVCSTERRVHRLVRVMGVSFREKRILSRGNRAVKGPQIGPPPPAVPHGHHVRTAGCLESVTHSRTWGAGA